MNNDVEAKSTDKESWVRFIFVIIATMFIVLAFTACSIPQKKEVVTLTDTVEVKTAVKCEVPKLDCEFSGTGVKPGQKLLQCVILQKKIIEACTTQKGE